MEFRLPKCKCEPGKSKFKHLGPTGGYVCLSCRTKDERAAAPEDMELYKKVKTMFNTILQDNWENIERTFTQLFESNFEAKTENIKHSEVEEKQPTVETKKKRGRPSKKETGQEV